MDNRSGAATVERAHSLATEAIYMVALQRRRLRSAEPEDETLVFRRWADFQFLRMEKPQWMTCFYLFVTS
jgi:hypothetical protein